MQADSRGKNQFATPSYAFQRHLTGQLILLHPVSNSDNNPARKFHIGRGVWRGGGGIRAYYSLLHAASSGPNCVRRERAAKEVLNNSRGLGDNARIGPHYYSVRQADSVQILYVDKG